jgi:Fe2+ or Zn2+ uptake regulation protein
MTSMAAITSDEQLIGLLHARGQRVTPQRLVIHRVLRQRDRHLTAEDVHDAVKQDLPGTSTPTVYATLDLLTDLGVIRRLDLGSGPALYDARTETHHHMICRRCGKVEDLEAPADLTALDSAARTAGFEPMQTDVLVSGLCADCAAAVAAERAKSPVA